MLDLRRLDQALRSADENGQVLTPLTLTYLLHQSRPESFADSLDTHEEEPLTVVAAEAACAYLSGLETGQGLPTVPEQLVEEERATWAVRSSGGGRSGRGSAARHHAAP